MTEMTGITGLLSKEGDVNSLHPHLQGGTALLVAITTNMIGNILPYSDQLIFKIILCQLLLYHVIYSLLFTTYIVYRYGNVCLT